MITCHTEAAAAAAAAAEAPASPALCDLDDVSSDDVVEGAAARRLPHASGVPLLSPWQRHAPFSVIESKNVPKLKPCVPGQLKQYIHKARHCHPITGKPLCCRFF
jgi:hypothetical protein